MYHFLLDEFHLLSSSPIVKLGHASRDAKQAARGLAYFTPSCDNESVWKELSAPPIRSILIIRYSSLTTDLFYMHAHTHNTHTQKTTSTTTTMYQ